MFRRWYKHQGFLVAFYFPTVYRQFLCWKFYNMAEPIGTRLH